MEFSKKLSTNQLWYKDLEELRQYMCHVHWAVYTFLISSFIPRLLWLIYEPILKLLLSRMEINAEIIVFKTPKVPSWFQVFLLIYSLLTILISRNVHFNSPCLSLFLFDQFVAQPNCQQLLATLWYDGFPGWRRRHWVVKLVTCFIIGLLFPVFSLVGKEKEREWRDIEVELIRRRKWKGWTRNGKRRKEVFEELIKEDSKEAEPEGRDK